MSFLVVPAIPLSSETRAAFRMYGGVPARLDRTDAMLEGWCNDHAWVLNMGRQSFDPQCDRLVINRGPVIAPLIYPGHSREVFGELMPPFPDTFPVDAWIKAPGRGGRGKNMHALTELPDIPDKWDLQVNIEGKHFRIITVGDVVVQDHEKEGTEDPEERLYHWRRMEDVPRPVKHIAREAARRLSNLDTMIGWDIIYQKEENRAYLLEGNSSPGVNAPTVGRIMTQIELKLEGELDPYA